jgi:hypothetical protein
MDLWQGDGILTLSKVKNTQALGSCAGSSCLMDEKKANELIKS